MTDGRRERDACDVNSRHHQAVKDLAPGLRVSATAPDGVIDQAVFLFAAAAQHQAGNPHLLALNEFNEPAGWTEDLGPMLRLGQAFGVVNGPGVAALFGYDLAKLLECGMIANEFICQLAARVNARRAACVVAHPCGQFKRVPVQYARTAAIPYLNDPCSIGIVPVFQAQRLF